jgi:hypothetical protein
VGLAYDIIALPPPLTKDRTFNAVSQRILPGQTGRVATGRPPLGREEVVVARPGRCPGGCGRCSGVPRWTRGTRKAAPPLPGWRRAQRPAAGQQAPERDESLRHQTMTELHHETLEEEATHATDEARMHKRRVKPGREEQFREAWRRGTRAIIAPVAPYGSRCTRPRMAASSAMRSGPISPPGRRPSTSRWSTTIPRRAMFVPALEEDSRPGELIAAMEMLDDVLTLRSGPPA